VSGLVLSQLEFNMSMVWTKARRGAATAFVFAGATLIAGNAMAQLSSNKGGRETVPGGVEAKPGDADERPTPKSTMPGDAPAPGTPPRTRSLGGSPAPAPAPLKMPAPSKVAPDAKKAGEAK
jgi:hypothetical protein